MRRKDKEILDRQQIDLIMHKTQVLHLGMCRGDQPYVIPISFGYDGQCLYLHTAREGTKIDFWTSNPNVCFQAEYGVKLVVNEDLACEWGQTFYSVIGFGTLAEVTGANEKSYALNQIMRHYSERDWDFDEAHLNRTRIWQICVEKISGKKSKENPNL